MSSERRNVQALPRVAVASGNLFRLREETVKAPISTSDEYPTVECPKCGKETPDMDGFGFIACIPGCGHCRHVAASKHNDGWRCDICSASLPRVE